MNYLLSDTSFWAFVGLILFFVVIIFVGAPKMIGKALDDRADLIRKELDEARRLREEAQELMATYERKQTEAAANDGMNAGQNSDGGNSAGTADSGSSDTSSSDSRSSDSLRSRDRNS